MQSYNISNKGARTLNRVVGSSDFRSPEAVLRHLIQHYAHGLIQPSQIVIDLQPAEDGTYHTQKKWIALYNAQEGEFRGKRMISAPDIIGAPEIASPEALTSLQKDCIYSWVITSSHTSFRPHQPNPLAGNVIHNYQSSVVSSKVISLDEIPVLQGESANRVVETAEGLSYLRALADDRYAKPETLLKRLTALSQRDPEDIALWTPEQGSRGSYPERPVVFGDLSHRFCIEGDNDFDYSGGHSRGVLINPRSGRAKK